MHIKKNNNQYTQAQILFYFCTRTDTHTRTKKRRITKFKLAIHRLENVT